MSNNAYILGLIREALAKFELYELFLVIGVFIANIINSLQKDTSA